MARLRFLHELGEWEFSLNRRGRMVTVVAERRTVCWVLEGPRDETEQTLAQGFAYCSPDDRYDRETGRQVALFEAVRRLPKGCKEGSALIGGYLHRPGATPWRLDKAGHLKPRGYEWD